MIINPSNVHVAFRALAEWRDPSGSRSASVFKAGWPSTLGLLKTEAAHLGADLVVIEIVTKETAIRRDETGLKANAFVAHPGAAVSMETQHGPMRFACDRYTDNTWGGFHSWRKNTRAIALTLEALRSIDRWGATHRAEQYTGWLQLEGGTPTGPAPGAIALPAGMTLDEAVTALGELAQLQTQIDPADTAVVKLAYRKAARRFHPDSGTNADMAEWHRLQDAMRVLGVEGAS